MSRRRALLIVGALAAFVLSDAPQWTLDVLFNPWARADPPLLDRWVGQVTAPDGEHLDVVFALVRPEPDGDGMISTRVAQIEGRAATCDGAGRVRRYWVSGSPRDRAGRHLRLGFGPDPQGPDGQVLSTVEGTWDGADTLTLQVDFYLQEGPSVISSSDDRVMPMRMRRQAWRTLSPRCAGIGNLP